ncbi:hypothetical protein [Streptomyces sp. NPDC048473]|uniref:hypothetical protein n=1 Tax=unclassified Streptomyces TaxID=2593676 RepID=UPI0037120CA0
MSAEEELLSRAYLAYNGQDVDGLLLNRIRPIFGEYYGDPETADDLTGAEKPPSLHQSSRRRGDQDRVGRMSGLVIQCC